MFFTNPPQNCFPKIRDKLASMSAYHCGISLRKILPIWESQWMKNRGGNVYFSPQKIYSCPQKFIQFPWETGFPTSPFCPTILKSINAQILYISGVVLHINFTHSSIYFKIISDNCNIIQCKYHVNSCNYNIKTYLNSHHCMAVSSFTFWKFLNF